MAEQILSRVLVVDDDPAVRNMLEQDLTEEGFLVHTLCDGSKVADLCANEKIQVVITDLDMPKKNGLQILQTLQRSFPEILIIVISGHCKGTQNFLEMASWSGAHHVLAKPFRPSQLLKILRCRENNSSTNNGYCKT